MIQVWMLEYELLVRQAHRVNQSERPCSVGVAGRLPVGLGRSTPTGFVKSQVGVPALLHFVTRGVAEFFRNTVIDLFSVELFTWMVHTPSASGFRFVEACPSGFFPFFKLIISSSVWRGWNMIDLRPGDNNNLNDYERVYRIENDN